MNLQELDAFHRSRPGYLLYGLAELALAYLFLDLAVNSGSIWQWAVTLVIGFGGLRNLVRFVWSLVHVRH